MGVLILSYLLEALRDWVGGIRPLCIMVGFKGTYEPIAKAAKSVTEIQAGTADKPNSIPGR